MAAMSDRDRRFRRTYLTGIRALQQEEDPELWEQFRSAADADGPFEELLSEGKFDEALSVFRAHAPFGEADIQRVPAILTRALPRSLMRKFTDSSLYDFLSWIQYEVAPGLQDGGREILRTLIVNVAMDVACRALESTETASSDAALLRHLALASLIVKAGECLNTKLFERVMDETIILFRKYRIVRQSKSITLTTSSIPEDQIMNAIYKDDVELMLIRGAGDLAAAVRSCIRPWCELVRFDADMALLDFVSNPLLLEDAIWFQLPDLMEDPELKIKAALALVRNSQCPFKPYVRETLDRLERFASNSAKDAIMKERRILDLKEIAAIYGAVGTVDVTSHIRSLQAHIAATCAGAETIENFVTSLDHALSLSSANSGTYSVVCAVLHGLCDTRIVDDIEVRINVLLQRLHTRGDRIAACHEVIFACVDDCQFDGKESSPGAAAVGHVLCEYIRKEADLKTLPFDLEAAEAVFSESMRESLELSTLSDLSNDDAVQKSHDDIETSARKETSEIGGLDPTKILECSIYDLDIICSRLNDTLVVRDVVSSWSYRPEEADGDDEEISRAVSTFRDCPNAIRLNELQHRLSVALSAAVPGSIATTSAALELNSIAKTLDINGAPQAALRVRMTALDLENLEDALFRLASGALQRQRLDESLIFGYLTSLRSNDSALLLLKAESKRLNDAFLYMQRVHALGGSQENISTDDAESFDFARFQQLSSVSKQLARAFGKTQLLEDSQRSESLAKWLVRLSDIVHDIDKVRFIRYDIPYLNDIAGRFLLSMIAPTDFTFATRKLETFKEFVADFMLSSGVFPNALSSSLAYSINELNPKAYDGPALVESLRQWSKYANKDALVQALNEKSLVSSQGTADMADRIELITQLLVELEPERDAFIKRAMLLGESWADVAALVQATTIEDKVQILIRSGLHGSSCLVHPLEGIGLVHSALEWEVQWDDLCERYIRAVLLTVDESGNGDAQFKTKLFPLIQSISNGYKPKWALLLDAVGLGSTQALLKSTKERLICLQYIVKNQKRLPSSIGQLDGFVRETEVEFLFQSLGVDTDSLDVAALVKGKDTDVNLALIRTLMERTDPHRADEDVLNAAKLLVRSSGGVAALGDALKRLVLEWLNAPLNYLMPLIGTKGGNDENVLAFVVHGSGAGNAAEDRLVLGCITRALKFLGGAEAFLRKFAYTRTGTRQAVSNLARGRALKVLNLLGHASEDDMNALVLCERMSQFEACKALLNGAWKQSPEQIFDAEVDRLHAANGLLRDLPTKYPLQCASFVTSLALDLLKERDENQPSTDVFSTLGAGLEAMTGASDPDRFDVVLNLLLALSPDTLVAVVSKHPKVWQSTSQHYIRVVENAAQNVVETTAVGQTLSKQPPQALLAYISMLERCECFSFTEECAMQLSTALRDSGVWIFLQRRVEMLLNRITLSASD